MKIVLSVLINLVVYAIFAAIVGDLGALWVCITVIYASAFSASIISTVMTLWALRSLDHDAQLKAALETSSDPEVKLWVFLLGLLVSARWW